MRFYLGVILQLTASLAAPAAMANPAPERASTEIAQGETCSILGTSVNCRYHTNTGSTIEHVFNGGSAYFSCNSQGQCINGNW